MAVTKILARDFLFELNTGTVALPVWTLVTGLDTWSHAPASNDADTTTFDEMGRLSHLKASRGDTFTLTGKYKEDEADGSRDPGQEAVEAWGDEIGPSSLKPFRITSPGGTTKTFDASATVKIGGGGNDDAAAWEAALVVSGAIATV